MQPITHSLVVLDHSVQWRTYIFIVYSCRNYRVYVGQAYLHALSETVGLHPRNPLELINHPGVLLQSPFHNCQGVIHLPSPLPPHCSQQEQDASDPTMNM
jgi:hypothetical protein